MTAALVGVICVAISAAFLISLHFLPTGLDPTRRRFARLIVVAASIL